VGKELLLSRLDQTKLQSNVWNLQAEEVNKKKLNVLWSDVLTSSNRNIAQMDLFPNLNQVCEEKDK